MLITEDDVRGYLRDQLAGDNPLYAGELRYTTADIAAAMRTAAREYNSLPPIGVGRIVEPDNLPGDTNVFLDGIAAALLRTTLVQLCANDLEVQAGNVVTRVEATQIAHLKGTLIPMFDERFRRTATDVKISHNLASAFGAVGGTLY